MMMQLYLQQIHRPTASELARKRKADKTLQRGRRDVEVLVSAIQSLTPQQRVKQFNNECFSVSNNKLFCLACQEELSVKSSVIGAHIKLTKHNTGKEKLKSKKKKEIEIAEALKAQNSVICPKGESLPDN